MAGRFALVVATYTFHDPGLRQLTAPAHDAEALAEVLADPAIGGFEVTTLINEPHHVVGSAVGDFFTDRRRDDLTLLYFSGHGLKDDAGKLYLAMTDTRTLNPLFTSVAADQIDYAMTGCHSNHQILILDCCYSGAFPVGAIAKADDQVHALESFSGRGRTVLTASDATQYAFEGEVPHGQATQSVFTRHLVTGLRDGGADLDQDGDITVDELYSYVHDHVVAERPRQRPKKQDNVEGRTVLARNRNWQVPQHIRSDLESPAVRDRRNALEDLDQLYRTGGAIVRTRVRDAVTQLVNDDSRAIAAAAAAWLDTHPTGPATTPTGGGAGTPLESDSHSVGETVPATTPERTDDAARHQDSPTTDQAPPHPGREGEEDEGVAEPAALFGGSEPPPRSEHQATERPDGRARRRLRDRRWAVPMAAAAMAVGCVAAVGGWYLAPTGVAGHAIGDASALRGPDIDLLKLIAPDGYYRNNCGHMDPDTGQVAAIECETNKAAGMPMARFYHFANADKLAALYQTFGRVLHTGSCPGDPPGPDAPVFDAYGKPMGRKTCALDPSVSPAASVLVVTDEPDLAIAAFYYKPSDWTSPLAAQLRDYRAARGYRQFLAVEDANDPDEFTSADKDLLRGVGGGGFTRSNCRHENPAQLGNANISCSTPVTYPDASFLGFPNAPAANAMYQSEAKVLSGHACDGRPGQDTPWTQNDKPVGRFTCVVAPADAVHPDDHTPCLISIHDALHIVSFFCARSSGAPQTAITTEADLTAWFQKKYV
ncbi:caspase domain-containing protein [Nocardia sp. NPDC059764]|uniref:caspase family protein n=1 Tax=Nocardia sp. NPDC059764 TaxID=3346939 RepID=UPI003656FE92